MRLDNRRGTAGLGAIGFVFLTALTLFFAWSINGYADKKHVLSNIGIAESSTCGIAIKGDFTSAEMRWYSGNQLTRTVFGQAVSKDWTGIGKTGFVFECNNIPAGSDRYVIQIGSHIKEGMAYIKSGYIQNLKSYPSTEEMIRTLSGELK